MLTARTATCSSSARSARSGRKEPLRCPHCRLLVGAGRAGPTPSAEPGARGSAAGVFAHEAKRAGGEGDASKRTSARRSARGRESGARPERLLMVDYQQRASGDESLPALSTVFAAYGSWKRARRAAATARAELGAIAPAGAPRQAVECRRRWKSLFVLAPFVVVGIAVAVRRVLGRSGAAREAYLTRGGQGLHLHDPDDLRGARRGRAGGGDRRTRGESEGGVGSAAHEEAERADERGKELFVGHLQELPQPGRGAASGVTGPDLDELGGLDAARVNNAIESGGTGQDRMPADLLQGEDAEDVAGYVVEGGRRSRPPTMSRSACGNPRRCRSCAQKRRKPALRGFSVRRLVSTGSMAASIQPKLRWQRGAGEPDGHSAGANRGRSA